MSVEKQQNIELVSTIAETQPMKTCYFCGLEVEKYLLGQHNKRFHAVVHFDWVNGNPLVMHETGRQLVTASPMPSVQAPPLPKSPPPRPIIPKPPKEIPPYKANIHHNASKISGGNAVKFHGLGPIDYDMDISAGSDSDSEYMEGNLFNPKNTATELPEKNLTDDLMAPSRLSKPSKSDHLSLGDNQTHFGHSKALDEDDHPKLNFELEDGFVNMILTGRMKLELDSENAEYAEYPYQSEYKCTNDDDGPTKRRRLRSSSVSTISSMATTSSKSQTIKQLQKVSNVDVRKLIEENIKLSLECFK